MAEAQTATSSTTVEFEGEGRAQLGSGTTLEQAEYIAYRLAQRDAVQTHGVDVLARTDLLRQGGDSETRTSARENITTIAAGRTRLKEGTKVVRREIVGQEIYIVVNAVFYIDESKLRQAVELYSRDEERFESVLRRARDLEGELDQLSTGRGANTPEQLGRIIDNDGSAQRALATSLSIDGRRLADSVGEKRLRDIGLLYSYIDDMSVLSLPSNLIVANVSGSANQFSPERASSGGRNVRMKFTLSASPDRDQIRRIVRRRSCIDGLIRERMECTDYTCFSDLVVSMYPLDRGEIFKTWQDLPSFDYYAALAFTNERGEVVALTDGVLMYRASLLLMNNISLSGRRGSPLRLVSKELNFSLPIDVVEDVRAVDVVWIPGIASSRNRIFSGFEMVNIEESNVRAYHNKYSIKTINDVTISQRGYSNYWSYINDEALSRAEVGRSEIEMYMGDGCDTR